MKNHTCIFFLFLIRSILLFSEEIVDPTPPVLLPQGPNMYTFPIYGDVPVDHYTGTMHFTIPIHEINIDGCKVPISLDYVGNGIKVSQDASNVGLGWYLRCGGNISLDCYGQDDFEYNGGYLNTIFPEGIPNDTVLYRYKKNNNQTYDITIWDTRPDIYHYNFSQYSGRMMFFRNNRHVPKLLDPMAYLDIYYERDNRHWTIYDADGNKYCFGNKFHESANGMSGFYTPTGEGGGQLQVRDDPSSIVPDWSYRTINAWPIDTIITNHGHQILFAYHLESQRTPVLSREEIRLVPQSINPDIAFPVCQICTSGFTESYHTSEISQAVLDWISFPGGTVQFFSSPRLDVWSGGMRERQQIDPTKIDSIYIKFGNKIIKRVHFHYHYMGLTTTPNTCRLILDSISGLSPRPYVFTYYTGYLPKKNSRQIDMWGYYNNSLGMKEWGIHGGVPIAEGTLVPSMELGGKFYYGRNRKVEPDVITNAMLRSVTYPTGGKTVFTYEPNRTLPSSTDAECIESVVSTQNISLIHNVSYLTNPATVSLSSAASVLSFNLDSTSVLDANISTYSLWGGPQQSVIISYLVLKDSIGTVISRKELRLTQTQYETDWHFQLLGQYPAGTYTLTLEDAQNTSINLPQPPVSTNSGALYTLASVTHSKQNRIGNNLEYAAGVRIASIEHYDENDSLIQKKDYLYILEDSTSSGLLMVHPQYHKLFTEEFLGNEMPTISPNHWCYPAIGYIVTSDMLVPPAPMAFANPIGYSRVIETIYPKSQHGSIEYIYYNHLGNAIGEWPNFACVGNELNGELLKKNIYSADNILLEKNHYLRARQSSFGITGLHYLQIFPPRYYTAGNQSVDNIILEPYSFRHIQTSRITTHKVTYTESGDSIVEIYNSILDSCLLLPRRNSNKINQDSIVTSYVYALNDSSQIGQALRTTHNHGALLQSIVSENGHVQDSSFYQYSFLNNHSVLSREYHLKADNAHDTICSYRGLSFDSNNNPTTVENESLVPVACIWGCNRTLPIVQAIGITNQQLQAAINPGFFTMLCSSCDISYPMLKSVYTSVTSMYPYVEIVVRSYIVGVGVSCEITPQGVAYLYDYDEYGRLKSVSRDVNGERRIMEQYEYHLSGE